MFIYDSQIVRTEGLVSRAIKQHSRAYYDSRTFCIQLQCSTELKFVAVHHFVWIKVIFLQAKCNLQFDDCTDFDTYFQGRNLGGLEGDQAPPSLKRVCPVIRPDLMTFLIGGYLHLHYYEHFRYFNTALSNSPLSDYQRASISVFTHS